MEFPIYLSHRVLLVAVFQKDSGLPRGHCRPDVFRCEVWIVLQQFSLARALRELAQDELHRDSCPRITGFPIIIAGLISIRSVVIAIPFHSS